MPRTAPFTAIAALLLCAAGTASAETYKWIDAQGQVHYSDRPPPAGATQVELIPAQTFHAPASSQARAPAKSQRTTGDAATYSEFEMRRPQSGAVIPNSGGSVSVELRIDPVLQPGHSIYLYMDGKRVDGLPTSSTSLQLSNVTRGDHQLVAAVVDNTGKAVVSTPAVTLTVRQTSIAKPPQGPALRPPTPKN
ncbi:MAG TPA: DUF4124 domain-containing protein [Steroidobacteraceae bacterium]|nr:DUF4124 domain-containing protein [Steroidobacteraceae bacterium]